MTQKVSDYLVLEPLTVPQSVHQQWMLSVAMWISHMAKKIKQQIKQSTIWEHQSKANHEIDWKGIKMLDQETVDIKRKLKLRPSISDASIQPSIEMGVENFLWFSIICHHVTNSCDCAIQLKATILKNRRPLKTTFYFSNNCNSLFH